MIPNYVIIHHSLTRDSGTVSWGAIRRYHTETNGWKDIGYHYGIELVENDYEVLVGRPQNIQGAHCPAVNSASLGICFVGNFDLAPPPDEMLIRAVNVFAPIIRSLGISWNNIYPHSKYSQKTCPGKMFPMDGFIRSLKQAKW